MRILAILIFSLLLVSCEKDKFTTEPKIEFKEFDRNQGSNYDSQMDHPSIILEVTDAEGDLGFKPGEDTSKIYIKNLLTNRVDSSMFFPNLGSSAGKNFKGELQIGLFSVMGGRDLPSSQRPYTDTLYFEVYITDFAGHQSNVVVTTEPFIYHTLP